MHKINPNKDEEKVFIAKKVLISKMDEKDKKGSLLEVGGLLLGLLMVDR